MLALARVGVTLDNEVLTRKEVVHFCLYLQDCPVCESLDMQLLVQDEPTALKGLFSRYGDQLSYSGIAYSHPHFDCDVGGWNLTGFTDFTRTFDRARDFTKDIGKWDVSSATTMESMFRSVDTMDSFDLRGWQVSNVENFEGMFTGSNVNHDLNNWNTTSATNMKNMFLSASEFNRPLEDWDVSRVTDMEGMFQLATQFNQPLNRWDVRSVEKMDRMFSYAFKFNQPLERWNVPNDTTTTSMFQNALELNDCNKKRIDSAFENVLSWYPTAYNATWNDAVGCSPPPFPPPPVTASARRD